MGIPVGGGIGGIILLIVILLLSGGLPGGGTDEPAAQNTAPGNLASCRSGKDLAQNRDCRFVFYQNSIEGFWAAELPRRGRKYSRARMEVFDGSTNTVYANYAGETMLRIFHDVSSGLNYETFYKYNSAGQVILTANPSALTGYDDTKADLLNSVGGNYQFMSDSAGLVTVTDFAATTTATSSTPGDVAGYYQDTKIQQGETGSTILQAAQQYIAHTASGITIYPVANATRYRNTNGGAETTSY